VEAWLIRGSPLAVPSREAIGLRGGILGYQLPTVRAAALPFFEGDVLVMFTDGIRAAFMDAISPRAPPREVADAILARHARGSDDALVLVAKVVGDGGGPGRDTSAGSVP
jgi:hypothetical protein